MVALLEQLRMDMGVPKEDSLNRLDFGYGSVKYSSGPYFYDSGNASSRQSSAGSNSSSDSSKRGVQKHTEESNAEGSRKSSVGSLENDFASVFRNADVDRFSIRSSDVFPADHEDHNHLLIDSTI